MSQKDIENNEAEYTYQPTDKRIYERIGGMLLNKSISIRKIFNI